MSASTFRNRLESAQWYVFARMYPSKDRLMNPRDRLLDTVCFVLACSTRKIGELTVGRFSDLKSADIAEIQRRDWPVKQASKRRRVPVKLT
jgi:hypothetical protein